MGSSIVLMPQYMRAFKCIGAECEDTCCIGWRVDLDEDTFKKYKRVHHPELTPLFEKYLGRNRSKAGWGNYGKIKMKQGRMCPFLTDERLCCIQLLLGEEYLSNICYSYPRIYNEVDGRVEKSATMSCPEAARLAILNPNIMEFDMVEERLPREGLIKTRINSKAKSKDPSLSYFWDLREFSIDVIQNRNYCLEDRLLLLGMFCKKVKELKENGKASEIPSAIEYFRKFMEDSEIKELLEEVPVLATLQMRLLKELADQRFPFVVTNNRYLQCFAECLHGLEFTQDADLERVGEKYSAACAGYYKPFMRNHEYMLENYLVNHIFKNLFPFDRNDVFDSYIMLVVHYALIKLILIGMSSYHKGLTTELVLKLIQSFAKTVEHNSAYLQKVLDLLHANNYDSLAWMSILIRN
ncbi:MAG: flagellin lysine-N-methylase [Thermacetogeniaceae bacterium]